MFCTHTPSGDWLRDLPDEEPPACIKKRSSEIWWCSRQQTSNLNFTFSLFSIRWSFTCSFRRSTENKQQANREAHLAATCVTLNRIINGCLECVCVCVCVCVCDLRGEHNFVVICRSLPQEAGRRPQRNEWQLNVFVEGRGKEVESDTKLLYTHKMKSWYIWAKVLPGVEKPTAVQLNK